MSTHGTPFDFLGGFGANVKIILALVGLAMMGVTLYLLNIQMGTTVTYILKTSPIWLPVVTFLLFFEYWLEYVRKEFSMKQGRVTLEIKIPQEIFKSPEAMELVLIQMHQTAAPDNHVETYIDGKHPPKFALELVSRGGDVRFYMNVPRKKFKNMVETQMYAQYPGIEVHELDIDYTAEIPWNSKKYSYFSIHFGPKKADAYPIKTYIDFGLDSMPKEEEKSDPITSMLEMLGGIGPGEYMWIQIIITAHKETNFKTGTLRLHPDWKDEARAEIKKIIENAQKRIGSENPSLMNLTEAEKDTIKSIERSLSKNPFNVAIRGMYIAESDKYLVGERVPGMITAWRSYDDLNRNAIGVRWRTDVDWPWWQDRHGHHRAAYKKQELDEYKRRVYTHQNHSDDYKVMTTEELATIFHLPGKVAFTPSLARIPSKRAEPPANLPIG